METDRFAFDLLEVAESGALSRDVTARVTNVTDRRLSAVELFLSVSTDGSEVETFSADVGALDPGESLTLDRTLSVGPMEGMRIKSGGATLELTVHADGESDRLTRSASL